MKNESYFPQKLYVYRDGDEDDYFYITYETLDEIPEREIKDELVATYELKDVGKIIVNKKIEIISEVN